MTTKKKLVYEIHVTHNVIRSKNFHMDEGYIISKFYSEILSKVDNPKRVIKCFDKNNIDIDVTFNYDDAVKGLTI